ncbi:MAG TPA: hypothetical protein VKB13_08280 [Gaiellaceae bacterium]|nr:hypothetical protein [Gaiellaceae bacterium]
MIAAGIGLILAGLILGLFLGVPGFIASLVGLAILILALVGVGRRSAEGPSG